MLPRELFLSIGITLLVAAAIFFYIQHKFKRVDLLENKIDTLFTVVQDEAQKRERLLRQQSIKVKEIQQQGGNTHRSNITEHEQNISGDQPNILQQFIHDEQQNIRQIITEEESSKINVSDDDNESDEYDSDLSSLDDEDLSDTDSDNDDNEQPDTFKTEEHNDFNVIHKSSLNSSDIIDIQKEKSDYLDDNTESVKNIEIHELDEGSSFNLKSVLQSNTTIENDDDFVMTSVIDNSLETPTEPLENNVSSELDDLAKAVEMKQDDNDTDSLSLENEDLVFSEDESEMSEQQKNWNKMKVGELRDLVTEKELHTNPKKLKKAELIEILEHTN